MYLTMKVLCKHKFLLQYLHISSNYWTNPCSLKTRKTTCCKPNETKSTCYPPPHKNLLYLFTIGYFKVHYSDQDMRKLAKNCNSKVLWVFSLKLSRETGDTHRGLSFIFLALVPEEIRLLCNIPGSKKKKYIS